VALALAERIGGEIVSVDSMQVYRGMDIGTAKPTAAERRRVRHHLIDVVEVTEPFDAAQFARLAHPIVREIHARGGVPVLCGGTGLYFRAFLEGLGNAPAANATLRAQLEKVPLPELLRELAEKDPDTYQRIDRQNLRRVLRALEVVRLTGQPHSRQKATWSAEPATRSPALFIALRRSSADLRARIDARVEEMFARGLVRETERLLAQGLAENRTALQAIGYRQVVEFLRGQRTLAETIALVKQRTRQFAKRQMTWFRGQAALRWVELAPDDEAGAVAEGLERLWKEFLQTRRGGDSLSPQRGPSGQPPGRDG
jgi:tRNA dimethylallyltransferase